jgi:hypothetical protein
MTPLVVGVMILPKPIDDAVTVIVYGKPIRHLLASQKVKNIEKIV